MSYKKKTRFFQIPIVTTGCRIEAEEEEKIVTIIENQLMAAKKGINCCVFRDGNYKIIDNYDNTFNVILSGNSNNIPLEGMVNGGYLRSEDDIVWENMIKGNTYYLYVQWKDGLYENPSNFNITYSQNIKKNNYFVLLAKLDLTKEPTIDTNPEDKIYYSDLASHITDNINPHGETLIQDKMKIKTINIECEDETLLGGLIKFLDKRTSNDPLIEVEGEFIVKDINGELKTNSKSLVGAINEIYDLIKGQG